jgi:acyl-CoA hydrolase
MKNKILQSETRQFKAIFPNTLNANDTLFGGQAMKWMDEVAYITATRFTRQRMVTINTENIKFLKAVNPNTIVELIGRVEKAGAVRLRVKIEVFVEEMYGYEREKAIEGIFVFASLDDNKRPKRIKYNDSKTKHLKEF